MLAFPLVLLASDRLWTRFIRSRKSAAGRGFLSSAPSLWLDQCGIHMASGERVLFRAMGISPSPFLGVSFIERSSLLFTPTNFVWGADPSLMVGDSKQAACTSTAMPLCSF